MAKDSSLATWLVLALSVGTIAAQTVPLEQTLPRPEVTASRPTSYTTASAAVAERFHLIGHEITRSRDVTATEADQAIVLLTAAKTLDTQAAVEPLLLQLVTQHAAGDYSPHVRLWLEAYVSATADRRIVADGVRYLLDRLDSQQERQALLERLVREIGNRNPVIDSDLALRLGRIMVEKGDLDAAKFYLIQAYTNNKFNTVAFAGLGQLAPDEIGPVVYLEHLRLSLREDPVDLDAALNVAQYAEQLQLYELAAGTYGYSAGLFAYLYPTEPLPSRIYLPWAISSYNSPDDLRTCLRIAESLRSSGRFDLFVEAIAGRAAAKMGNPQEGRRILDRAEQRALQLLQDGPDLEINGMTATANLGPRQLAWFYSFARPEPEKALQWANEAYALDPNAPAAGSLLAYALTMNDILDLARPLLASFRGNQITDMVQAQLQLAQGDRQAAIETLRTAIGRDPGSLAAERAREMLHQAGGTYAPPINPQMVWRVLRENLGEVVIPRFLPPDEMIGVQLNVRGGELAYGEEIEAAVVVSNQGSEPLVITDGSLFRGRIRVDAGVRGDLSADIPNLVSETVRTQQTIPAGRSLTRSLRLSTGQLRSMLLNHPQANLTIEFTLYIDPVVDEDGSVRNRLADVQPVVVSVSRPGLDVTASYIRNRFNAVASGSEAQKIRTAQLFTGLLKEMDLMARRGTLYPYRYAEWLPKTLRSALVGDSGLLVDQGADGWAVKTLTMADMLSMPLDQDLAAAVAANLHDPHWPVRLMAVYLLAISDGRSFGQVLDWVARNDANDVVRSMAMALRNPGVNAAQGRSTAVSSPPQPWP